MRLYALVFLVGCASPEPSLGGGSLTLALSAPSPFDRVLVFARGVELGGDAIATPGLLAANVTPPATASVWASGVTFPRADLSSASSSYLYTYSTGEVGFSLEGVAAIAREAPAGSSFAFGETMFDQNVASYHASLGLHVGVSTELWGPPNAAQPECLRVESGGTTEYIVTEGDRDCDGLPDAIDCRPDAYCDPTATSTGAQSGCACP